MTYQACLPEFSSTPLVSRVEQTVTGLTSSGSSLRGVCNIFLVNDSSIIGLVGEIRLGTLNTIDLVTMAFPAVPTSPEIVLGGGALRTKREGIPNAARGCAPGPMLLKALETACTTSEEPRGNGFACSTRFCAPLGLTGLIMPTDDFLRAMPGILEVLDTLCCCPFIGGKVRGDRGSGGLTSEVVFKELKEGTFDRNVLSTCT